MLEDKKTAKNIGAIRWSSTRTGANWVDEEDGQLHPKVYMMNCERSVFAATVDKATGMSKIDGSNWLRKMSLDHTA